jgi:hypothetical protein
MFNTQFSKRLKLGIGIFFALMSFLLGFWLVLLMLGYSVDFAFFGLKPSFVNYVRFLAEAVVASLLLAAIAFL